VKQFRNSWTACPKNKKSAPVIRRHTVFCRVGDIALTMAVGLAKTAQTQKIQSESLKSTGKTGDKAGMPDAIHDRMRITGILLSLIITAAAQARIGETAIQFVDRYGPPRDAVLEDPG
jgi:hypothetical protein